MKALIFDAKSHAHAYNTTGDEGLAKASFFEVETNGDTKDICRLLSVEGAPVEGFEVAVFEISGHVAYVDRDAMTRALEVRALPFDRHTNPAAYGARIVFFGLNEAGQEVDATVDPETLIHELVSADQKLYEAMTQARSFSGPRKPSWMQ